MAVWEDLAGLIIFFFFQAEDGIRDYKVTGVQTCALPICARSCSASGRASRTCPSRPRRATATRGAARSGRRAASDERPCSSRWRRLRRRRRQRRPSRRSTFPCTVQPQLLTSRVYTSACLRKDGVMDAVRFFHGPYVSGRSRFSGDAVLQDVVVGLGVQATDRTARSLAGLARGVDQLAVSLKAARMAVRARRRDRAVEHEDPDNRHGRTGGAATAFVAVSIADRPSNESANRGRATCRAPHVNPNRENWIIRNYGAARGCDANYRTLHERVLTA